MRLWATVLLLSLPITSIGLASSEQQQTSFFQGLGNFPDGGRSTRALMVSADGFSVIATGTQLYSGVGALFWNLENIDEKIRFGAVPSTYEIQTETIPIATNGTAVVGSTRTNPRGKRTSETEAFIWSKIDGMQSLGDLPDGEFSSATWGISADGTVVAGTGTSSQGTEAFIWTKADGMKGLGDLPGGKFASYGEMISADGTVIAGRGTSEGGSEAFIWTKADGMQGLGDLPGGEFNSTARQLSADGTIVIGAGYSDLGEEGFIWTKTDGMKGLGNLSDGLFNSRPTDLSADGKVIVGIGYSDPRLEERPEREAFIWTETEGMMGLGHLNNEHTYSAARAVSADGSTVIGVSGSGGPFSGSAEAFIWNDVRGMRSLEDVLEQEYGLNLTGWSLHEVSDISADGLTMVGTGF